MTKVTFSSRAYCKIILHCAKYPHCAVNGILLAANQKNKESSKNLFFIDAVPLFHLCLQLTPMAEIALTQVEVWAESVGLVIAGYYFANEHLEDLNIDRCVHRIADKISETFANPCLALVDNKLITVEHEACALKLSQCIDKKWKQLDKTNVTVITETLEKTCFLLEQNIHNKLVDFDNHLDNISLDWTNSHINDVIDEDAPALSKSLPTPSSSCSSLSSQEEN